MYLACAFIEHYPIDNASTSCEKTVVSDDVSLMVWNTCYFSNAYKNILRIYTAAGWRSAKFRGG